MGTASVAQARGKDEPAMTGTQPGHTVPQKRHFGTQRRAYTGSHKGERLIGYLRVSTEEQVSGLEAQRTAILSRYPLVDVWYVDQGESGSSLERPAFREALEWIAEGRADGLVVAKLDRLTRSVVDLCALLEWFDRRRVTLVALDLGLDTSKPAGRMVAHIMASVAQWEREVIADRTSEALQAKRARGEDMGRPSVLDDSVLLATIRSWREDEGLSLQQIADRLKATKIPTLRGGKEWRPSAVQHALGYRRPRAQRRAPNLP